MRTVALVARRADGGHRDRAWEWIRTRWEANTDIPIYVGTHTAEEGPYNNSAARNRAAAAADADGGWDIAVIMDADSFCGFDQIDAGIDLAATSGLHSICFTRFCYLSEAGSRQVMDGYDGSWEPLKEWHFYGGCSSMLCVPRAAWDAVGGMDEGFTGWGWEDVAFSLALQSVNPHRYVRRGETYEQLVAGFHRLPGDCWHLWHPVPAANAPDAAGPLTNKARAQLYIDVAGDRTAMAELLERLRTDTVEAA